MDDNRTHRDHDGDGDVLDPIPGREDDPTLMRNQDAVRHSTGSSWLFVGALFAAAALVVFGIMLQLRPLTSPVTLSIVVALFVAMIVVRATVSSHRIRLRALAALLIAMAAVSLIGAVVVSLQEWSAIN